MVPELNLLAATLQAGPPPVDPATRRPVTSLLGSAVGSFLVTLVVGWIMATVAPAYTEGKTETLRSDPLGSLLYGLVFLGSLVVLTLVLVFSIVGILLVFPVALLAVLVWAVGAALAYLTIGVQLVGRDDGWLKPLVVGAAVDGVLTVSGIGTVVAFAISAAGFGAILRDIL